MALVTDWCLHVSLSYPSIFTHTISSLAFISLLRHICRFFSFVAFLCVSILLSLFFTVSISSLRQIFYLIIYLCFFRNHARKRSRTSSLFPRKLDIVNLMKNLFCFYQDYLHFFIHILFDDCLPFSSSFIFRHPISPDQFDGIYRFLIPRNDMAILISPSLPVRQCEGACEMKRVEEY